MNRQESLIHEIPPVFDERSRVLILGSFPSPKSREQGFFYGHPQNRMWRVLADVFEEDVPETPEKRKAFLKEHRIAMWDVLESCEITGASDASIKNAKPNDLSRILDAAEIAAVFTTGGKAAQYYKKFDEKKYDLPHFRLPSTSPANARMKLNELADSYRMIRKYTE